MAIPKEQQSPFPLDKAGAKSRGEAKKKESKVTNFDKFKKWFDDRTTARTNSLGNYAFMDISGKISDQFGGACFSHLDRDWLYRSLYSSDAVLDKEIEYFAAHVVPVARSDYALAMAKWMANDSHWAPLILTKDPQYILTKGTIWSADASPYFIYNGANILRDIYEHSSYTRNWYEFANAGVDPHAAVVFGMAMMKRDGRFRMDANFGHHTFINAGSFGAEEFTNYMQNKHVIKEPLMREGNRKWSSRSYLWGWGGSGYSPSTTSNHNTHAKGRRLKYSGGSGAKTNAWGEEIKVESFDIKDLKKLADIWIEENTVVGKKA